jgi:hypothetical protein
VEDEVRLRTSVTFGYSPSNRLPMTAHHKPIIILHFSLRLFSLSTKAKHNTEYNTPTGDYCIILHMVIYCVTTHPKNYHSLGSIASMVLPTMLCRTMCFSVKCISFLTHLQRLTASVRHIYPIAGLSFYLATKASH